jgi:hypothetical protein
VIKDQRKAKVVEELRVKRLVAGATEVFQKVAVQEVAAVPLLPDEVASERKEVNQQFSRLERAKSPEMIPRGQILSALSKGAILLNGVVAEALAVVEEAIIRTADEAGAPVAVEAALTEVEELVAEYAEAEVDQVLSSAKRRSYKRPPSRKEVWAPA